MQRSELSKLIENDSQSEGENQNTLQLDDIYQSRDELYNIYKTESFKIKEYEKEFSKYLTEKTIFESNLSNMSIEDYLLKSKKLDKKSKDLKKLESDLTIELISSTKEGNLLSNDIKLLKREIVLEDSVANVDRAKEMLNFNKKLIKSIENNKLLKLYISKLRFIELEQKYVDNVKIKPSEDDSEELSFIPPSRDSTDEKARSRSKSPLHFLESGETGEKGGETGEKGGIDIPFETKYKAYGGGKRLNKKLKRKRKR